MDGASIMVKNVTSC